MLHQVYIVSDEAWAVRPIIGPAQGRTVHSDSEL